LDIPPQVPELEWITTEDLATEILRRSDAGIIITVSRLVPDRDTMGIYKRGCLEQTLLILHAAANSIVKEEM
jgi:hypothetical protein